MALLHVSARNKAFFIVAARYRALLPISATSRALFLISTRHRTLLHVRARHRVLFLASARYRFFFLKINMDPLPCRHATLYVVCVCVVCVCVRVRACVNMCVCARVSICLCIVVSPLLLSARVFACVPCVYFLFFWPSLYNFLFHTVF